MRLGSESIQQSGKGQDQLAVMQFITSSAYNDMYRLMDSPKGNRTYIVLCLYGSGDLLFLLRMVLEDHLCMWL